MGRTPRAAEGAFIDHEFNRDNARLAIFDNDGDYDAFKRVPVGAVPRYAMTLLAYCAMPNQFRLVLCLRLGVGSTFRPRGRPRRLLEISSRPLVCSRVWISENEDTAPSSVAM